MKYSFLLVSLLLLGCSGQSQNSDPDPEAAGTLAAAFDGVFLVGGALGQQVYGGRSPGDAALAGKHFNTITPENDMKWERIHPERDRYDFESADAFVAFGEEHDMFIVGHTLVWHSQTPRWVYQDDDGNPLDRDGLLARMEDHISTIVGRYKGRIHGWDVVNEALNEDGTLRETAWHRIIGPDYLEHAFRFAHAADPDAKLYYNDYSLTNPQKRAGAIRMIRGFLDAGVPIHGVGEQGHYTMEYPTFGTVDTTITELASLGLPVMITELDVDVLPRNNLGANISASQEYHPTLNPYTEGMTEESHAAHAARYRGFFEVFVSHRENLERVTLWGVSDGGSWLNNWPVGGRTNHALLFDREFAEKPSFDAVIATAPN